MSASFHLVVDSWSAQAVATPVTESPHESRPTRLNEWTLSDYQPQFTGRGRGLYDGSFFDETGRLLASIAQEVLFR